MAFQKTLEKLSIIGAYERYDVLKFEKKCFPLEFCFSVSLSVKIS